MRSYRSLTAWQRAHELCLATLRTIDAARCPRTYAFCDQLQRAALSVELNIVEGYALGTRPLFRRHLRIAFGSAAEVERLLEIGCEAGYLSADVAKPLLDCVDETLALLFGLLRHEKRR